MWHWVDLVIIGIIILSILTGVVRGFIKELIALCVWVLAIWLSYNHSHQLAAWLQTYIQDAAARRVAAFIIVLLAVLIVGGIANALISSVLKRSGLSGTDRLLGMGFGFLRGVFIVALIIVVLQMTSIPQSEYAKDSLLYQQFAPMVSWMHEVMPDFIKKAKEIDPKQMQTAPKFNIP